MELFDDIKNVGHINQAIEAGIYPYFHALESAQDTEVVINGKRTIML
ncbi:MAG: 8-amino-7-oxononanoate synthase, partial [Clostridiales bacterium]|nr:8-amino-7-oxononanoate synthase [Clostridiales bacterium]